LTTGTSDAVVLPLGRRGFVDEEILLMAGRYDVTVNGAGGVLPALALRTHRGLAVSGDAELEVTLTTVTLAGRVTRDDEDVPDDPFGRDRGRLELRAVTGDDEDAGPSGAVTLAELGDAGDVTYETRVFPGAYELHFVGNASVALDDDAPVPGQQVKLRTVRPMADARLDVDLATALLRGSVTRDGDTMPDDVTERGVLLVVPNRGDGTAYAVHRFGARGPVDFARRILAGSYDLVVQGDDGVPGPQREDQVLPDQTLTVRRGVAVVGPGVIDLDVETTRVSGRVTLDGAAVPGADADRGSVSFVHPGTLQVAAWVPLGARGDVEYDVRLFAGTYDVHFGGNPAATELRLPTPPQSGLVRAGVAVSGAEAALDVDVTTVLVVGRITSDGEPLPDDPEGGERGTLLFVGPGAEVGWPVRSLPPRGDVTYEARVLAGLYDIVYDGPDGNDLGLPSGAVVVWEALALR
jgi:hypothetical protein